MKPDDDKPRALASWDAAQLHNWEYAGGGDTHRMTVPGGWLYAVGDDPAGLVFVPRPSGRERD